MSKHPSYQPAEKRSRDKRLMEELSKLLKLMNARPYQSSWSAVDGMLDRWDEKLRIAKKIMGERKGQ